MASEPIITFPVVHCLETTADQEFNSLITGFFAWSNSSWQHHRPATLNPLHCRTWSLTSLFLATSASCSDSRLLLLQLPSGISQKSPILHMVNGSGFSLACGLQRFSYFRAALNGLPKADLTSSFLLYSDSVAYNCFVQRLYSARNLLSGRWHSRFGFSPHDEVKLLAVLNSIQCDVHRYH